MLGAHAQAVSDAVVQFADEEGIAVLSIVNLGIGIARQARNRRVHHAPKSPVNAARVSMAGSKGPFWGEKWLADSLFRSARGGRFLTTAPAMSR